MELVIGDDQAWQRCYVHFLKWWIIRPQRQSHFWKPHWYLPQIELLQQRIGGRITLVTQVLIYRWTMAVFDRRWQIPAAVSRRA
jgi:hypothetical protein